MRQRLSRRVEMVWWRVGKYWKTHRANSYRSELHFRVSKNIPVTVDEWQRSNELLREAKEY